MVLAMAVGLTGCGLFETLSGKQVEENYSAKNVDSLESGRAYVWKNAADKDEKKEIEQSSDDNRFFLCVKGNINFKGEETSEVSTTPRSIWVYGEDDAHIPTVTSKDVLLYVSEKEIPESIVFERFADYGYSIGVSNMEADGGDHYFFPYADLNDDDYMYYVNQKSDAKDILQFKDTKKLFLDKVGDVQLSKDTVSKGGSIMGLEKGKKYVCEFYTGTFYQDFSLTADSHIFSSMERFVSYDYRFLHSNCIAITIPEYLKTGYYYVNGVGLFRYVKGSDESSYSGASYDAAIDWNDPIILYDENGFVIYDPRMSKEELEDERKSEISKKSDVGDINFKKEGESTNGTGNK